MRNFILFLISLLIFSSCYSWKKSLASQGDKETMIRNCIIDFSHTKLYKEFDVFEIHNLSMLTPPPDISILTISPMAKDEKIYPYLQDTVGLQKNARIPTKFIVMNNKLFIWEDSLAPITQELINIYEQFNIIDKDWLYREHRVPLGTKNDDFPENINLLPPYVIYDWIPCAKYYICKNDYTNYIRDIHIYELDHIPEGLKCN